MRNGFIICCAGGRYPSDECACKVTANPLKRGRRSTPSCRYCAATSCHCICLGSMAAEPFSASLEQCASVRAFSHDQDPERTSRPIWSRRSIVCHFFHNAWSKNVNSGQPRSNLPIVERDSGVFRKARFTLTPERPHHNADECDDEDQKIDCRFHDLSPTTLRVGRCHWHT